MNFYLFKTSTMKAILIVLGCLIVLAALFVTAWYQYPTLYLSWNRGDFITENWRWINGGLILTGFMLAYFFLVLYIEKRYDLKKYKSVLKKSKHDYSNSLKEYEFIQKSNATMANEISNLRKRVKEIDEISFRYNCMKLAADVQFKSDEFVELSKEIEKYIRG